MSLNNIVFNWEQTGTNCEMPIKEVKLVGHFARVYKAYDTKLWTCIVDNIGERHVNSEKEAIQHAENVIRYKIENRILKAKIDLLLLADYID